MTKFLALNHTMQYGDLVLLYRNPKTIYPIYLQRDGQFDMSNGAFPHKLFIGQPFGSVILSHNKKEQLYALRPTPDLWSRALSHRTQIVYPVDASIIIGYLNVNAGSRIIESGTGSASLTHFFSTAVGENGHVYTYEYHESRYNSALKEFEQHLLSNVSITHRDVCLYGFNLDSVNLQNSIDAVFLDLPEPWKAIESAKQFMKQFSRICCFSPCIEQVQKTVLKLVELEFTDIIMVECLENQYEVFQYTQKNISDIINRTSSDSKTFDVIKPAERINKGHTAFLTFATKSFE